MPMSKVPFIHARFFDGAPSEFAIEKRLQRHLIDLRVAKHMNGLPAWPSGKKCDSHSDNDARDPTEISVTDQARISRRAERLVAGREAASRLGHLKTDDRKRLDVLKNGVRVVMLTEHRADEIGSAIHEGMPWMAEASTAVWHALRHCAFEGLPAYIPPLILNGPPAVGKTFWAQRVGALIGVPTEEIDAGSENASFGVSGTQKGWGSQGTGRVLETILRDLVANPVVFVDELDKAGRPEGTTGQAYRLDHALLSLLEPSTNANWSCPYFRVRFDMSHISWILATNDVSLVSGPLRSRSQTVEVPLPSIPQLIDFVLLEGKRRGLTELSIEVIVAVLEIRAKGKGRIPDLRVVLRMLRRAAVLEKLPFLRS